MKIQRLVIENFKSIERIELVEPNPFTVFVGPNGSGKSNIFEALEFWNLSQQVPNATSLFGGLKAVTNRQNESSEIAFTVTTTSITVKRSRGIKIVRNTNESYLLDSSEESHSKHPDYQQFSDKFSRIFVKNEKLVKLVLNDDERLSISASNLEKVLKRLLANEPLKEEIFEWLELFVPGFKSVEIDDRDELHWFENSSSEYFTKDLISDGTYNILALLTAVYQSDEPQFLCIEEPENGLHPQVLESLVNFFRQQCEEKGHFIWLNTHSEAVVRHLTTDEIVLVNKRNGATQTRQIKGRNIYNIPTDEAWLTGALGGGLPW